MRRARVALAALAAVGLSAAVAHAADPASGTVSSTSPTVTWTGTVAESGFAYNVFANNPDAPCAPPACDTFALEVADGGLDLTLSARLDGTGADGSYASHGFRITKPDGSRSFSGGESGPDREYKLVIKKAPKGAYTVDSVNTFVGSPGDYTATATLGVPKTAPTPTPSPSPGPSPTPSPGPGQQGTTLSITTRSASSKRVRKARKLPVALRSSGRVEQLVVSLRKGSRTLAKGKRASLESKGKVTLKVRKRLKPGKYTLVASGRDAQGQPVSASASLKVKR